MFSIFVAIFFSFVKNLIEKAESAKNKILSRTQENTHYEEYYTRIIHFTSITSKYFTLLGIFMLFQILKIIWNTIEGNIILNIGYFFFISWYFSRIWKTEIVSPIHPRIFLAMYFAVPSIGWLATNKFSTIPQPDFIFSIALTITYIIIWFGVYTELFSPLTNLKKLLELMK